MKKKNTSEISKYPKKKTKRKHKVTNWSEYNRSLVNRGNLHVWIDTNIAAQWNSKKTNKPGRPFTYSDTAILLFLRLRVLFKLPLRQTQGLLTWLLSEMGLSELKIPDHSQVCRRAKKLKVSLNAKVNKNEALYVLVDSTGLKVYGEGEWKVKKHGYEKRRTWKKLHLCVDDGSFQIVSSSLTDVKGGGDAQAAVDLLKDAVGNDNHNITGFTGDGAYDAHFLYNALQYYGIKIIRIPPHKSAKTLQEIYENAPEKDSLRDVNIKAVREKGLEKWKKESDYHRRSRIETAMYRYKQIIGNRLKSRCTENQITEHKIACQMLNMMASLGMPKSIAVA